MDFHTHIFPPCIREKRPDYAKRDPCFAALYSSEKAGLITVEELIASMDKSGIDISVVVNIGWTSHELCVETNDYILEAVARYPQRLIGFCAVQPLTGDTAISEIKRCAANGIRGIGEMRPDIQKINFTDKAVIAPFIKATQEHNLILMVHTSEPVGHEYPGKGSVTPEVLYPLITGYPELKLVLAHWGGGFPFYTLMPEVKQALKNTYFDTAASPFLYSPQIYREVINIIGAEKILFGSDYPLMPQNRLLDEINRVSLTDEERGLILSSNAKRLLELK
ncbi:amidohydrolase family protein [Chloroflexota bacterium]